MEESDQELGFFSAAPSIVCISPFSSITPHKARRLSSCFSQPSRPVHSTRRLAYVSLQGRVENAEEASSARAIGGGLSRQEAAGWELFSPMQRFLIVAVIGVAAAESKKNRQIWQLKKSVELRDQVLSSMQQELDNLCEQANTFKDQPEIGSGTPFSKNADVANNEAFGSDKMEFVGCGCWLCDQHRNILDDCGIKPSSGHEVLQYKMPFTNEAEQEERRMSDLSDWASSVTSAAEIQLNSLAFEQDIYNLKRECEEKDGTIKELTTILRSSDVACSKRIAELEDIIRRKNLTITRLKKDMVVLEQKVVQLTRARRPSFSSDSNCRQLPVMSDNLIYDMDSTTSPSSSDSDSSPVNLSQIHVAELQQIPPPASPASPASPARPSSSSSDISSKKKQNSAPPRASSSSLTRLSERRMKSQQAIPLKEISTNHKSNSISSLRHTQLSVGGENAKKSRRRPQTAYKAAAAP